MISLPWPHRRAAGTAGRRASISHDPRTARALGCLPITRAPDRNDGGTETRPSINSAECCSPTSYTARHRVRHGDDVVGMSPSRGRRRRANRRRLSDQLHRESDDEAHHKDGCGCHGDQINGPRVIAFTDKVEVTGPAFVSVHVKMHGSGLLRSEADPEQSQMGQDKAPICRPRISPSPAAWGHLGGT